MGFFSFFNRLSPIKKGVAVMAFVVLIYAILGFLFAPSILETQLVSAISRHLDRTATLDNIKVNPFTLSVTVVGFEMSDPGGERFIGFKELFINFRLFSVFQRVYTFDEIRLDAPEVRVTILSENTFNFSDLLVLSDPPAAKKDQGRGLPPIRILRLRLNQGRILFSDLSLPTPYKTEIFPLKISMDNFTTRKDVESPYTFTASSSEGGLIRWEGNLSLNPFRSKGRFALTDFNRRLLYEYFQDQVRFDMQRGLADFSGQYVLDASGDVVHFELIDTDLNVSEFSLLEKGVDKTLISIPLLSVKKASVNFSKKEAVIEQVTSNDARIEGWINADGVLNYQTLFASEPAAGKKEKISPTTKTTEDEGGLWQVLVNEVKLNNYEVWFEDQTPDKPVRFLLKPLDIHLKHLSSRKNTQFEIELNCLANQTGDISIKGTTSIHPVAADLAIKASGLGLPVFQPYIDTFARLDVVSGAAGLNGKATFHNMGNGGPKFRYKGMVNIDEFEADNRLHHDDFIKWASLSINDITLELSPDHLNIEEIVVKQPYAKVIIWPDRTINVMNVFASASETTDRGSDEPEKKAPMPMVIGQVIIDKGSANFADQSITPNFATGIHEMNGSVKGLSSKSLTRADILIQGKVDRYAPVKITGQINPLSEDKYTDLVLNFKNIELTTLTPYSGKFAGYLVEKGKLSLDLKYKLSKNILIGENEIFLNQLTLGERVDSPHATSLPVLLAVALLKDSKGNIDINLPVRGNFDDPEFGLGHILLKAFINLITKIVTSPFAALGGLVGGDGEALGFIEFEFGKTVLGDDQTDKLGKLALALNERPALGLEIKGVADKRDDWRVLAEMALLHQLKGAKIDEMRAAGQPLPADIETFALSDEEYNRLLIKAYVKKFGEQPKERMDIESEQVRKSKEIPKDADNLPPAGGAKPSSSDTGPEKFISKAKERLIKTMAVDETKLHQLAVERSKQIRIHLVEEGKVSDERLFIVDVEIVEGGGDDKIRANLKLTGI